MSRIRSSSSSKDVDQCPAPKRSRQQSEIENSVTQHADSSINQSINQPNNQLANRSSYSYVGLFANNNFIMPLVAEYLNDGDVIARLLTVNKLIKSYFPKYKLKRICDTDMALKAIESKSGVALSVTKVETFRHDDDVRLLDVIERSNGSLTEVYHRYCYRQRPFRPIEKIPDCVTHLKFFSDDLLVVAPGLIPDSVTHLNGHFQKIKVGSIPSSIRIADLLMSFDSYRSELILSTITSLSLTLSGARNIDVLPGIFPSSLTKLDIASHIKPFVSGVIPSSVTELTCNYEWLTLIDVGVIPGSVITMKIHSFKTVHGAVKPNVIPNSVTHLEIRSHLVNLATCHMPSHLTHLIVNSGIKSIVAAGMVPNTLTHLHLSNTVIKGAIPNSVTHLRIPDYGDLEQGAIPSSVTHLELESGRGRDKTMIPTSVTHLVLGWSRNPHEFEPDVIPTSVTHLVFHCGKQQKLLNGVIPNSVTHLVFHSSFDLSLSKGFIPDSVTHLVFGEGFNSDLSVDALPHTLKHLCFGSSFNKSIHSLHHLASLETLVLGYEFNQPIHRGDIPNSVKYLVFGSLFKQKLDETCLPQALTYLEIPRGCIKRDAPYWLPPSLTYVSYQFDKPVSEHPAFAFVAYNSWYEW